MTRVDLARLSDVASGVPSGTAFPGSPSDGDLFYRTDLDLLCRYRSSGTRWVTVQLFSSEVGMQTIVVPLSASQSFYAGLPNQAGDTWLEEIRVAHQTQTPTDGTNYWTVSCVKIPSAGALGSAFDTKSDTAGTATGHTITIGALSGTTDRAWQISMVKTSSPGVFYLFGATLFYRRVVT